MQESKQYRFFVLFAVFISLGFIETSNAQVPAPPAETADRMGIYCWGFESSAYQAETEGRVDRLNWAAGKVSEIGSRTIRLTLPGAVYGLAVSGDLAQVAASAPYDKLFSDSRFKTYLLTTTTTGAFIDSVYPWSDGYTEAEYAATRAEIAKLGDYLLGNPKYAGKTFIILNWESDNELYLYANKQTAWDAFVAWIQSRADGVKDARGRNPNSQAKLYSGFEFNLIRTSSGVPCGMPVTDPIRENPLKNRCAVDYVAPRVEVDYYSYSSWQTLDVKVEGPNGSYKEALKRDLNFALAKIKERRPEIEQRNFIIGEFGIHRTRWSEKTVANYVAEMIDAVMREDSFQVSYAVWWQIIDNLQFNIVWDEGFGLFRSRNGLFYMNLVGDVFKKKLAGQSVTPLLGGPFLRRSPAGIVNAATGNLDFHLNPNDQVNVFADGPDTPFSASGNRITIEQMMNQFIITRGNSQDFNESAMQISATLPKGVRPGYAFMQVLDGNGVETQAQFVLLDCAACPGVSEIIDSDKQLGEFHSGTTVTITGSNFSPTGNTVVVEQQDVTTRRYRFTVPSADVIEESPTLIKVKLPRDLIVTKFTAVLVTNRDGLESNMYPLRSFPFKGIEADCQTCAPAISIKRGIVTRDSGIENFVPQTVVTISGDRFSTSGNTVVVEQGSKRYVVERDTNWSETPSKINATLPSGLKPGYAIIYVINQQGQESKAQAVTIARGTLIDRSPIRRGDRRSSQ